MIRRLIFSFVLISCVASARPAAAAQEFVKKEVSTIMTQFNDSRLAEGMFRAIGALLLSASEKLGKEGHTALAEELMTEWTSILSMNEAQFGVLDLGDHEPLNQWLARTYERIEAKLGSRVMHWLRYDDLKVLNFSIPVVFHPNGTSKESWDMVEYGKHFVPFTGAITYWTVNGACKALSMGLWMYACGVVSEGPRYAVEKWVAPRVSNRVYRTARRESFETADELDLESVLSAGDEFVSSSLRSE